MWADYMVKCPKRQCLIFFIVWGLFLFFVGSIYIRIDEQFGHLSPFHINSWNIDAKVTFLKCSYMCVFHV